MPSQLIRALLKMEAGFLFKMTSRKSARAARAPTWSHAPLQHCLRTWSYAPRQHCLLVTVGFFSGGNSESTFAINVAVLTGSRNSPCLTMGLFCTAIGKRASNRISSRQCTWTVTLMLPGGAQSVWREVRALPNSQCDGPTVCTKSPIVKSALGVEDPELSSSRSVSPCI